MPAQITARMRTHGGLRRKQQRGERTHMLVILPMHHRSPSAAGTVPTSSGVLAETALLELLGAVIVQPSGGHDAQLHIHGAPETVSKVTASTAPTAAMGRVNCAVLPHGSRRVRTADGRRGRWCRSRGSGRRWRRRSCASAVAGLAYKILRYPVVPSGPSLPQRCRLILPLSDATAPRGAHGPPRRASRSAGAIGGARTNVEYSVSTVKSPAVKARAARAQPLDKPKGFQRPTVRETAREYSSVPCT